MVAWRRAVKTENVDETVCRTITVDDVDCSCWCVTVSWNSPRRRRRLLSWRSCRWHRSQSSNYCWTSVVKHIGRQAHRFYDFVLTLLVACISLEICVGVIIIYIGNLHYYQVHLQATLIV